MTDLERLAKDTFEQYCIDRTGTKGYWIYLNDSRKLVWMEEVLYKVQFIANQIKLKIKPLQPILQNDTVYNMGYKSGLYEERSSTLNLIEYLSVELKEQLEVFKKQHDIKQKKDST